MKKIIAVFLILFVLFFSYLMLRITLPYLSFKPDVDFLLTKQRIMHIDVWRYSFYIHVMTSSFALVFGVFQFWNYFMQKQKKLHRLLGKIYVIVVVLLSGPTGFIMGIYANGGIWAQISFVILSPLWILFTWLAYNYARKKDFVKHRNFMIRSYALTLSAISLRLYAYFIPAFFHLNAKEEYVLISWCSWTLNLIVAEVIIFLKKEKAIISPVEFSK